METQQELQAKIRTLIEEYLEVKSQKGDLLSAVATPARTAAINANKALKAQLDTLLREVNLKQILASLS